jgi:lipoprotein-anchoring transpeptidase ErfK/SrfK
MNFRFKRISAALAFAGASIFFIAGCDVQPNQTTVNVNNNTGAVNAQQSPAQSSSQQGAGENQSAYLPFTLPVLDAMFAEENFAAELKSKLNLTDEQIERLRQTAREAAAGLNETDEGSTRQAKARAEEQIKAIIGDEKAGELAKFISDRWAGDENITTMNQTVNAVPNDTRIVVNAPAYRMDVFKDGELVRTYKVGIGYPEFPLPTGMRKANEIIFNPTWIPPDEPWVQGKVKPGQKVEAGSKLNPLGPIKIPIGLPSLIHGGKSTARLGTFASHGCVGLTSPQVQDFAMALAQISGTNLTNEDVTKYEKAKTETKNVKLEQAIPVELRYETIVVEDGKLKIYRDVYERGTNTEENLRRVLEAHGSSLDNLSEQERTKVLDALKKMAVDAGGDPVGGSTNSNSNATAANTTNQNANSANKNTNSQSAKVTRNIKGEKEITIEIAALKGKGYPAPVDLNTGGKSNKPLNLTGNPTNQSNTNQTAQQNSNGRRL